MSEDDSKVVTFEYENGDTYLGEVNENGEPHGRGVLKSKDNYETTNGWFKNGLLHGEATISTGYNKENEGKTNKTDRKGNYVNGLMQGTHTFVAFRQGKYRKVIQEFDKDNLIHTTNEDGTHEFHLDKTEHYDLLFSNKFNQKKIKQITFDNTTVMGNIDKLSNKLDKFLSPQLIFYSYSEWLNHKEKIASLFNSNNFNSKCHPNIWIQDIEVKNRQDVSSINLFIKYFLTNVYHFFSLSSENNFDNYEEFTIKFYDQSSERYVGHYNLGHNVHVGKYDLEEMKSLTFEENEKFCANLFKNYSIHNWMKLDNYYDIFVEVKYK